MHGLNTIWRLNNPYTHRFDFPPDYPMRPAAVRYEKHMQQMFENRVQRVILWKDCLDGP